MQRKLTECVNTALTKTCTTTASLGKLSPPTFNTRKDLRPQTSAKKNSAATWPMQQLCQLILVPCTIVSLQKFPREIPKTEMRNPCLNLTLTASSPKTSQFLLGQCPTTKKFDQN